MLCTCVYVAEEEFHARESGVVYLCTCVVYLCTCVMLCTYEIVYFCHVVYLSVRYGGGVPRKGVWGRGRDNSSASTSGMPLCLLCIVMIVLVIIIIIIISIVVIVVITLMMIRRFGTKCSGCGQGISPQDLVRKARDKVIVISMVIMLRKMMKMVIMIMLTKKI